MSAGDAAAHYAQSIDQRQGLRHGIAGSFPAPPDSFDGRGTIPWGEPPPDIEDSFGLWRLIEGESRARGIPAAHGANARAFFGIDAGVELVAQQPSLAGDGVVTDEQLTVTGHRSEERR